MIRLLIVVLALLCIDSIASAQSRVDATVVTVSGRSVYIDAGRDGGVVVGARVVFRLKTGELVAGTIVDVSATNARAELADDQLLPATDDHAEIEIVTPTPGDPTPKTTPPATKPVPVHPPWKQQAGAIDTDTPLLAPAFGARPEDRPMVVKGRSYSVIRAIKDIEHDANYLYARSGLWLDVRNPVGDGGRLLFQGDTQYRSATSAYSDSSDTNATVQRFSYAWGLDANAPFRGEVGRFFSAWLPELGIVDGGEGALRLEDGWSLGAGAGYYPTTVESLLDGDNYGFHVFADYQSGAARRLFQGTLGYQQTYQQGAPDRSLVIGRVTANPSDDLRLFGLVMVDLYGSDATLKTSSAEITQLLTQASFRFSPTTGVTASLVHTTWPELKRNDFAYLPPWLVADGYVDRLSGSLWTKLDQDWRMSLRSHYWRDQSRDGYGGELSLDWSMSTKTPSSLFGSIYYEDSAYTTGAGVRLQAQTELGGLHLFAGYDGFAYTTDTLTTGSPDNLRHTLRGDVSWGEGQWYWDVDTSYSFGSSEQSITIGMSVQYRF